MARIEYILRACLAFISLYALQETIKPSGVLGRKLSGQNECPVGCLPWKCVEDKTSGTFLCTKCANNLVVLKSSNPNIDGTCGCRGGRYYDSGSGTDTDVSGARPKCELCQKGNFCPGGTIASSVPSSCSQFSPGLTSVISAAKSKWACVELPGYGYTIVGGNPVADKCQGDTYNSGYSKKGCQSCPAGFQINDDNKDTASPTIAKHDNVTDCLAPPGYYLRSPSEVAACPQGEYQPSYNRANKCLPCPSGVTTQPAGNGVRIFTSAQYCNTLKPGYFAGNLLDKTENINSGSTYYVATASLCPQTYWCPGGMPTQTYTVGDTPTAGSLVNKCVDNTGAHIWTKGLGSSSKDQCMVPPGYGLDNGDLVKCASGSFREGWLKGTGVSAPACDSCIVSAPAGSMSSAANEQLTVYPGTDPDVTVTDYVIGTASACTMAPGYGMYLTASGFKVIACNHNTYGSAAQTYGRNVNPCRTCPANMVTPALADADRAVKNSAETGFTDPKACVTQPGFGWDGRASTQCPVGSYNRGNNRDECTQCPWGYSTANTAAQQAAETDCKVAPGFETDAAQAVQECPLGTYNDQLQDIGVTCASCDHVAINTWTFEKGADTATDCAACAPGTGKPADAAYDQVCIDCSQWPAGPAYGPADRENTECVTCPTQETGFTFLYNGITQPFISPPIVASRQTSATSCLSEFAQIEPGIFYLFGAEDDAGTYPDANGVQECSQQCGLTCMYFTYDYSTGNCFIRTKVDESDDDALLAFKTVSSGDVMGAHTKAVATGLYVEWLVQYNDPYTLFIGERVTADAATKMACMEACDFDERCLAVLMSNVDPANSITNAKEPPETAYDNCEKIYAYTDAGENAAMEVLAYRSLTHVVITRLSNVQDI